MDRAVPVAAQADRVAPVVGRADRVAGQVGRAVPGGAIKLKRAK